MAVRWINPVAVDSYCGGSDVAKYIDGSGGTWWWHYTNEDHWIVLDLGESYEVYRIRHLVVDDPAYAEDYTTWRGVEVWVSETAGDWGDAVGVNLEFASPGWRVQDLTDKVGRYVKISDIKPDHSSDYLRGYAVQLEVDDAPAATSPYSFIM